MQARHSSGSHHKAPRMSPGQCFNKGKARLACRYKITTGGIRPPHPWSHPTPLTSLQCDLPPTPRRPLSETAHT